MITLGFELNAFTLDLHLHDLADLRRWDFHLGGQSARGVVLLLTDGTTIEVDQPGNNDLPPLPPA